MIQLRQNQLKMIQKAMKVIVVTQINHQIVIHTNNLRAKVPLKIARQVTKRILETNGGSDSQQSNQSSNTQERQSNSGESATSEQSSSDDTSSSSR